MSYDPGRILDHLANRLPLGAETVTPLPEVPVGIDEGTQRFLTAVKTLLSQEAVTWNGLVNRGFAQRIGGVAIPVDVEIPPGYSPDLTTPPAPSNVAASGAMTNILVTWDAAVYSNHAYTEIWAAGVDNISSAVIVGQTPGAVFPHYVGTNTSRYYWVRFVSTADVKGPYNAVGGTLGTTGFIGTSNLSDAAVTIQKINDKRIAITGDTWTDNTPDTNSVTWSSMTIVYNGSSYSVSGGNTSNKWVYWTAANTTLSSSASFPSLADNEFLVAINNAGEHDLVWNGNGIARSIIGDTALLGDLVVGTANIQNAAITNAKVNDLAADKITAGDIASARMQTNVLTALQVTATSLSAITANVGQLVVGTSGYIRSGKTAYGSGTGWYLEANGSGVARFDIGNTSEYLRWDGTNLLLGGSIIATGNIQAGAITGTLIAGTTITGANIAASTITGTNIAGTTITSTHLASNSVTASKIAAGTITLDKLTTSNSTFNNVDVQIGGFNTVGSLTSGLGASTSNASRYAAIFVHDGAGTALACGTRDTTAVAAVFVGAATGTNYTSYITYAGLAAGNDAGATFLHGNGATLPGSGSSTGMHIAYGSYAYYILGGSGGPFTGAHDGLYERGQPLPREGDIMVDTPDYLIKSSVSDTITSLALSTTANQKGVVGVFAGFAGDTHVPASLQDSFDPMGVEGRRVKPEFVALLQHRYKTVVVNSIGEGLINVCGQGGDIEIGDLIVASDMLGKGMKQADDIVRSITVAKARENVTFSGPGQVKQIACIYLAG